MGSFNSRRAVVARKPHKCQCCYKPIDSGLKYIRNAGVWEGDFYSFKFHVECMVVIDIVTDYLGEAIDPSEAHEIAEEYGLCLSPP